MIIKMINVGESNKQNLETGYSLNFDETPYENLINFLLSVESNYQSTSIDLFDMDNKMVLSILVTENRVYDQERDVAIPVCVGDNGNVMKLDAEIVTEINQIIELN